MVRLNAKFLETLVESALAEILEVGEESAQEVEVEREVEDADEDPDDEAVEDECRDEGIAYALGKRIEVKRPWALSGMLKTGWRRRTILSG